MIKLFFAVFAGGFAVMVAALAVAPTLVLGAYQDDIVKAWSEAGVDTSSCDGSVPKLGLGVRECYEGSIRDMARQIGEANEDRSESDDGFE
jgi:hypothetical protein